MTSGPEYHPPRPGDPDPTRKHPLGEHDNGENSVSASDEQGDNEVDSRIGSSGMRPYGGDPDPSPENDDELPGEWHDPEINEQTDR